MAWWFTVYCATNVGELSPAQVLAGLRDQDPTASAGVDYDTLAEGYGIDDEAAVATAVSSLRFGEASRSGVDGDLHYQPGDGARPLVLHHWTTAERVAEELEEAEDGRQIPAAAVQRLRATKAIVAVELGYSQLEDMGIVIATELVRYLVQKSGGLAVDDDDQWFDVRDGAWIALSG